MRAIRPAAAVLAALTLTVVPTAAQAQSSPEPDRFAAEVERILDLAPGGVEIAPGQIAWDGGDVVLVLEGAATPALLAQCVSGLYCAWSNTGYSGSFIAFSGCSVSGTPNSIPGFTVRSIANKRSSGYVVAGSYVLSAGSSNSSVSGVTSMTCYS